MVWYVKARHDGRGKAGKVRNGSGVVARRALDM